MPALKREEIEAVGKTYALIFTNLDEVGHPSILYLPEFGALMAAAIDADEALTREQVNAVIPSVAWD